MGFKSHILSLFYLNFRIRRIIRHISCSVTICLLQVSRYVVIYVGQLKKPFIYGR